jgi:UTP--glucose-1-phosphate uridylyltransferase
MRKGKVFTDAPFLHLNKMVADMEKLAASANSSVTPAQATRFKQEMQGFKSILTTYRAGLESGAQSVDWARVSTNKIHEIIVPYEQCTNSDPVNATKLAVVKLNGGLGTTM